MAGAAEDVLPLFLDASTDWQVACKVVPGGHLLPYYEATASRFTPLSAEKKIKANYITPVQTMEQVMDRVLLALDSKLEKQTKDLFKHIDQKIEEFITTRVMGVFETKLNHTLDKITSLVASSKQISH